MHLLKGIVIPCFFLGLAAVCVAQDKEQETTNLDAKLENVKRAKFVDFGGQLGMPLASLEQLGERIDAARLAANPVELAMAAELLEAVEKTAGKKASLTAKTVMSEAIELARLRSNPAELSTIAKLVGNDELEEIAEAAAKAQEDETSVATKDLDGYLDIDNHSHEELHVYVNGREIGHVQPHSVRRFHVHHAVQIDVRDRAGHRWVARFPHWDHRHYFRMLINDPHPIFHPHH